MKDLETNSNLELAHNLKTKELSDKFDVYLKSQNKSDSTRFHVVIC